MSDEKKAEDTIAQEEPKVEQVVELEEAEKKPEGLEKPEEIEEKKDKIKLSEFSDIFVTESDTFDVVVRYYKKEDVLIVSDVDDDFDDKVSCSSFTATFKYPDQGDAGRIGTQSLSLKGGLEELDVREFLGLEFSRVLCLIRKWTIDQDLTNSAILKLHPKIVKSLINQVRIKIGTDGII